MRNGLIVLLLALFAVPRALATDQTPDNLLYGDESYYVEDPLLEPYFREHPEKRVEGDSTTTALYRKYIATFAIRDGELLLDDIQVPHVKFGEEDKEGWCSLKEEWSSAKEALVPKDGVLRISWFSGFICFHHYGKASPEEARQIFRRPEWVALVEVAEGRVVSERKFADEKAYDDYRNGCAQDAQESEAGKAYAAGLRKKGVSEEEIARNLKRYRCLRGAPLVRANNSWAFGGVL